jgi:hypothetical protein
LEITSPSCLSRANSLVALGSEYSAVCLWNIATGASKTLDDITRAANGVAISTDDRLLACGSGDGTIRLWDVETASCQLVLECQHRHFHQVAFSSKSKILASFGSKRLSMRPSLQLWDTESGQCRHIFDNLPHWVRTMAFSPYGTCIQTNAGNLSIPVSLLNPPLSTIQRPPAIFVGERWTCLDGTPIFWLPHEYRPGVVQVSGTTICIASTERKFMVLRLDLEKLKRAEPRLFQPTHIQEGTSFWER